MSFFRSTILITTALTLIVIYTVAADAQEKTAELANNSDLGIEDEDFLVPSARTKRFIGIFPRSRPCKQITNERNKLRQKIEGLNGKLKKCGKAKIKHLQRQVQSCKRKSLMRKRKYENTARLLKQANKTIAKKTQKVVRKQARILKLTKQVRKLKMKLNRSKQITNERNKLRQKIKGLNGKLKKCGKAKNKHLQRQVQSCKRESLTRKRKHENTARLLKQANKTTAKKTLKVVRKQARILKLTKQVQKLKMKLNRFRNNSDIDRLRGQLEVSQKASKMHKRLEEQCKSGVVSVKKLLMVTQGNLSTCQGRNEKKQVDINRMNERQSLLETSNSKLANKYDVTLRELKSKQQGLAEAQKTTQVCETDLIATNGHLTNAMASLNQRQQKVQALTEDLKRANRTAEEQLHTIAKVTSKLDECKQRQCVTTTTARPTAVTTTTTTRPTATTNSDSCQFFAYATFGLGLLFDGRCYSYTTPHDDWKNWAEVNDYYDGSGDVDVKGSVVVDSKNRHCLQQLLTKNHLNISIDRFGDDWGEKHVGLLTVKEEECERLTAHLKATTDHTTMATRGTTKSTITVPSCKIGKSTDWDLNGAFYAVAYYDCFFVSDKKFNNWNQADMYSRDTCEWSLGAADVNKRNKDCLQQLLNACNVTIPIERFGKRDAWVPEHRAILKLDDDLCRNYINRDI